MLPKTNRIRKKKEFEVIFKNSKSIKSGPFIFRIMRNKMDYNRFGFIISQKVSKRAVVRNRIRRRLVEAIKKEEGNIKKGIDVVVVVLPGADKKLFPGIRENIRTIFSS